LRTKIDIQELAKFGNLEFLAKQVVEGFITGLHRSPFHGFSVEFAEHRLYNNGESTKHIDWKLYAKTDKLFVKRYEEETNLRCRFVLDASSSMYFPDSKDKLNKISFSVYAIASLIELLKKQRDGYGISVISDEIIAETGIKTSQSHLKQIYFELEKLLDLSIQKPEQKTELSTLLHQISEGTHKRSLVVIFSDFFSSESLQNLKDAFLHLKHNKHEVIVFNILDKEKEVNFNFPNKPTTFIDLETGEKIKLHPNELKAHYLEKINAHLSELKMICTQFKIDFVDVDISQNLEFILQQFLIKRSKML